MALLRCTGSTPRSRAMAGSAVATIVPSMFCIKSALATTQAVMRKLEDFTRRRAYSGKADDACTSKASWVRSIAWHQSLLEARVATRERCNGQLIRGLNAERRG